MLLSVVQVTELPTFAAAIFFSHILYQVCHVAYLSKTRRRCLIIEEECCVVIKKIINNKYNNNATANVNNV